MDFLNQKIAQLRSNKNMSQRQLSERSGLSAATLSKIEKGQIKNIGINTLIAISNGLGVTLSTLLISNKVENDCMAKSCYVICKHLCPAVIRNSCETFKHYYVN